jgi:hypothetical protein
MASDSQTTADSYLIWWTSDYVASHIRLSGVPQYIQDEMHNRRGRAGRGRLWVPDDIPIEEMTSPYRAPKECAGIVIHARDAVYVQKFDAGFLTSLAGDCI